MSLTQENRYAQKNRQKADYISKLIMSGVVTGKDAIRAISEDNFKFDWIDLEDYKMPENSEVEKEIFNQWMDSYLDSSPKNQAQNDKVEDDDIDVYIDGAEWRTLKNGKRVLIDTETGELLLGGGDIENEQRIRPEEWGTAYTEYSGKGQKAVNFLLDKKEGYVPDVITVAGYGVDIPYGEHNTYKTNGKKKKGYGIAHIIDERNEQGINGEEFVKNELIPLLKTKITEQIKADKKDSKPKALMVYTQDKEGVIMLDWKGKRNAWLLTGYYKVKK